MGITNDKLKLVSGLNVISISEIIIDLKLNKHGFLKVVALVDENDTSPENMDSDEDVKLLNTQTNEILFCGIISSIEIDFRSGNKVVTLVCETGSSIFDREKKTRSFQNENISDIISNICKEYKTQIYIDLKDDKEQFSVQYEETDFEFMRRLASERQMVLVPHIKDSLARLYFGIKNPNKTIEVNESDFVRVDQMESKTETLKSYHVFKLYQSLDLGDIIKFKGKDLLVMEAYASIENSILCYTYKACKKQLIKVKKLDNELLIGATLKAKVIDAEYQSLKVKFHVDEEENKSKAKWINYSPIASNAWHSLPHIDNEVDVYFPSTEASRAIIVSTTRIGHDAENTMKNPKDKVFATKWGAKLALRESNIELSNSFTEIKLSDKIEVTSNDSLTIESLNEINIGETTIVTRDSEGNKISTVKSTKNINIEAEEMVSFLVLNKLGAIEVDDEVIFTSASDTIAKGVEKVSYSKIPIENRVWDTVEISQDDDGGEEKGGFWSNVEKCLLVAAVAVAAVAVVLVASVAAPAVMAALSAVAVGSSSVVGATSASTLMMGGGLAATGVAVMSCGLNSKLLRINRNLPEGDKDYSFDLLDKYSSSNWGFSKAKWLVSTKDSDIIYDLSGEADELEDKGILAGIYDGLWEMPGKIVDGIQGLWSLTDAEVRDQFLSSSFAWLSMSSDDKNKFWDSFRADHLSTNYDKSKFIASYLGEAFLASKLEKIASTNKFKSFLKIDDALPMKKQVKNALKVDSDDLIKYGDDVLEGTGNLIDPKLMDELAASGEKFTKEAVEMVTKNTDGKLLWLEAGSESAGLTHILKHEADLLAKGVDVTDIPGFIKNDLLSQVPTFVGRSAKGPYAEYLVNGNKFRLAYGDNGFIVSLFPIN